MRNRKRLNKYRTLIREELAADITPVSPRKIIPLREEYDSDEGVSRSSIGLIGVILSVVSFFILPYILAPIGIILGYIGFRKGSYSIGFWAMGLGVIGLLGSMIVSSVLS